MLVESAGHLLWLSPPAVVQQGLDGKGWRCSCPSSAANRASISVLPQAPMGSRTRATLRLRDRRANTKVPSRRMKRSSGAAAVADDPEEMYHATQRRQTIEEHKS